MAWKLAGGLLVIGVAAALTAWYALQDDPSPRPATFEGFATSPSVDSRFTGTASCSGRACHGRLEPCGERDVIQGNEHTTWLTHDRHADAYRVLFEYPSRAIAHLLDPSIAAHENKRCLACHVNPDTLSDDSSLVRAERQAGVGCETCHGAARDWLGPHTAWADLDTDQKRQQYAKHGMHSLDEPRERAELCVGCHVGTEPGRDVDHDLIAAGHPRLDFELTAFLANMPPHWIDRRRKPGHEARTWAVGQIVTARAALGLLRQRATSRASDQPWPEFAEYDCFACHHHLSARAWRRELDHLGGRSPGALPWNERYFTFLPELLGEQSKQGNQFRTDLAREMASPAPNRQQVTALVGGLDARLEAALEGQFAGLQSRERIRALIAGITNDPERLLWSWDAAAQALFALQALREARGDKHNQADAALRELGKLLAFPSMTDSPTGFRGDATFEDRFRAVFRRVHEAADFGGIEPALPKAKP